MHCCSLFTNLSHLSTYLTPIGISLISVRFPGESGLLLFTPHTPHHTRSTLERHPPPHFPCFHFRENNTRTDNETWQTKDIQRKLWRVFLKKGVAIINKSFQVISGRLFRRTSHSSDGSSLLILSYHFLLSHSSFFPR